MQAYDCVGDHAAGVACHVIRQMLEHAPRELLQRLAAAKAVVAIIGRHQVTTDIPDHAYMKLTKGAAWVT